MPNQNLVLLAEDNPVNQMVLGLLLEHLGVQFECANDGEQAVEKALAGNYGLILMDLQMPKMDGFEAALEIRKSEFKRIRHTPIIACTAMDEHTIFEKCVRSGIDDYIGKPIDRDILKQKIAYWSVIPTVLKPFTPKLAAQLKRLEEANTEPIDRDYLNLLYGLQQLDDVLELFLTVTESLLDQLESAIVHHDVVVVCRMAHEIKGSSYSVSAREMAKLCLELEQASAEQDWPEAEKLYTALGLAFARVRQFLHEKKELLNAG